MNNDNTDTKPEAVQTTSVEGLDDAACYASFEHEWLNHGYTFKDAVNAKNAYETWAGEEVSYEDVNYAITGQNKHSGLFWERISSFFAGYRLHRDTQTYKIAMAADKLHQAFYTMKHDWNSGDFTLPRIAEIHMAAIESKALELGRLLYKHKAKHSRQRSDDATCSEI